MISHRFLRVLHPFSRRIRDILRVSDIFNRTNLRFGVLFASFAFSGLVPLDSVFLSVPFLLPTFPAISGLLGVDLLG